MTTMTKNDNPRKKKIDTGYLDDIKKSARELAEIRKKYGSIFPKTPRPTIPPPEETEEDSTTEIITATKPARRGILTEHISYDQEGQPSEGDFQIEDEQTSILRQLQNAEESQKDKRIFTNYLGNQQRSGYSQLLANSLAVEQNLLPEERRMETIESLPNVMQNVISEPVKKVYDGFATIADGIKPYGKDSKKVIEGTASVLSGVLSGVFIPFITADALVRQVPVVGTMISDIVSSPLLLSEKIYPYLKGFATNPNNIPQGIVDAVKYNIIQDYGIEDYPETENLARTLLGLAAFYVTGKRISRSKTFRKLKSNLKDKLGTEFEINPEDVITDIKTKAREELQQIKPYIEDAVYKDIENQINERLPRIEAGDGVHPEIVRTKEIISTLENDIVKLDSEIDNPSTLPKDRLSLLKTKDELTNKIGELNDRILQLKLPVGTTPPVIPLGKGDTKLLGEERSLGKPETPVQEPPSLPQPPKPVSSPVDIQEKEYLTPNKNKYKKFGIEDKWEVFTGDTNPKLLNKATNKDTFVQNVNQMLDVFYNNIPNFVLSDIKSKGIDKTIKDEISAMRRQGADISKEREEATINNPKERENLLKTFSNAQTQELQGWVNYLKDNDAYSPAFKYAIFKEVLSKNYDLAKDEIKKRDDKSIRGITPLHPSALGRLYNEFKFTGKNDLLKIYEKIRAEEVKKELDYKNAKKTSEGKWVKFNSEKADPENFDKNVSDLSALVCNTNWCTKTGAREQLAKGDFYVYLSGKENTPRVAIRMEDNRVAEVSGREEGQYLEPDMIPVADEFLTTELKEAEGEQWIKSNKFNKALVKINEIVDKRGNLEEITEQDVADIYENVDLKDNRYRINKNWTDFNENLMRSSLFQVVADRFKSNLAKKYNVKKENIALDPYKLNNNKKEIELYYDYDYMVEGKKRAGLDTEYLHTPVPLDLGTPGKTYPNLKYIITKEIDLYTEEVLKHTALIPVESLDNLKTIQVKLLWIADNNKSFKSFGTLEKIEGDLGIGSNTSINNLGKLKEITGDLSIRNKDNLKSLGDIEKIGGELQIINGAITTFGKLKEVGLLYLRDNPAPIEMPSLKEVKGRVAITDTNIKSLQKIEKIRGDLVLSFTDFEDLGALKYVGGDVNISNTGDKLLSLGKLEEIGGILFAQNSGVHSLGNLRKVGGLFLHKARNLKSLGKVEEISRNLALGDNVKDLGNLREVKGHAVIRNSQIKSLGKLEKVGDYVDADGLETLTSIGNLKYVGGDAVFTGTKLTNIDGLEVKGNLSIKYTFITDLSKVKVGGKVIGDVKANKERLENYLKDNPNFLKTQTETGQGGVKKINPTQPSTKKGNAVKTNLKANKKKSIENDAKPKIEKESKSTSETEYQEAQKKLREKLNRPNMTFGLDTLPELYTIGKYHFSNTVKKFAEWAKKMIRDIGMKVKPYLKKVWDSLTKDRSGIKNMRKQGLDLNLNRPEKGKGKDKKVKSSLPTGSNLPAKVPPSHPPSTATGNLGDKISDRIQHEFPKPDSGFSIGQRIKYELLNRFEPFARYSEQSGVRETNYDPTLESFMHMNRQSIATQAVKGEYMAVPDSANDYKISDATVKKYLEKVKGKDVPFKNFLVARRRVADERLKKEYSDLVDLKRNQLRKLDPDDPNYKVVRKELKEAVKKLQSKREQIENDNLNLDDAQRLVDKHGKEFEEPAKIYDEVNKNILDWAYHKDLITEQAYNELKNSKDYASYQKYIEEYFDMGVITSVLPSGKPKAFRERKGSEHKIVEPVYSQVRAIVETVSKGLENEIWVKAAKLAEKNPALAERFYPDSNGNLTFRIKGNEVTYKAPPEFVEVAQNLNPKDFDTFGEILAAVGSTTSRLITSANPLDILRNFPQDQAAMAMNTKTKAKPLVDPAKSFPDIIKEIVKSMESSESYKKYLALGGRRQNLSGYLKLDPKDLTRKLTHGDKGLEKLKDVVDAGLNILELPGNVVELISRYIEFKRAKESGKYSDSEAMYLASQVTTPFQLGGNYLGRTGQAFVRSIPFLKANINAAYKFIRSAKENPARVATVAAALLATAVGTAMVAFEAASDKQKRIMANLQLEQLAEALYFPLPDGNTVLRLRIPEQIGGLTGMAYLYAIGKMTGNEAERRDYGKVLQQVIPRQLNIFDPGRTIAGLMPQLLKPSLESIFNVKSYPKIMPIVPQWMRNQEHPELEYTEYTSKVAQFLGKLTKSSPAIIDHFIKAQFGTVGSFLADPSRIGKNLPIWRQEEGYILGGRTYDTFFDDALSAEENYKSAKTQKLSEKEKLKIVKQAVLYDRVTDIIVDLKNYVKAKEELPEEDRQKIFEVVTDLNKQKEPEKYLNKIKELSDLADKYVKKGNLESNRKPFVPAYFSEQGYLKGRLEILNKLEKKKNEEEKK